MTTPLTSLGGLTRAGEMLSSADTQRASEQEVFSQVLARARHNPDDTPEQRARNAAEQLVSTSLVQPILKKLRDSNNAAAPFGPNRTERMFGSMMDATLAQRMVGSQSWGLVDQLARRMLERSQPPAAA